MELAWPLGPPDGRHVLRDPASADGEREITHVIVLASPPAPSRLARGLRGARDRIPAAGEEPGPVAGRLGRATVISVRERFPSAEAAQGWLAQVGEREVDAALETLGRLLHAHRIAAADPWLAPPTRERVLAVRAGYGAGEEVADGRFTAARELAATVPSPRRRRRALGHAEARLAGLLAGSERPLVCEELALRARLDLACARPREAALQLLVALDAAIAELSAGTREDPESARRVAELRERRGSVAAAAQAALSADPPPDAQREVAETLAMLEAALRARAVHR